MTDLSAVERLWSPRRESTRGPKPALSIEQIAQIAMEVADRDGLAAVSMQRVAEELAYTKMSLYRYVSGKAELLAVMIDRAVGVPPALEQLPGGWRARLVEWIRLLSQAWRQHPWLPWATVGDRMMGPNEVGWIEVAVAILAATPLEPVERLDAVTLICAHVRSTQSVDGVGTQPWHSQRQLELAREHAPDYPALAAIAPDAARTPEQSRAFGVGCILDGIERIIAARA